MAEPLEGNTAGCDHKDSFKITGPNGKFSLLSVHEKIDIDFLSALFGVNKTRIVGLRTSEGLVIRLNNPKFTALVNGKECDLLVSNENKMIRNDDNNNYSNGIQANKLRIKHFYCTNGWGQPVIDQTNNWLSKCSDTVKVHNIQKLTNEFKNGNIYHYTFIQYTDE